MVLNVFFSGCFTLLQVYHIMPVSIQKYIFACVPYLNFIIWATQIFLTPELLTVDCLLFLENKAIGVMKPGHSFTIEPMISEGINYLLFYHFFTMDCNLQLLYIKNIARNIYIFIFVSQVPGEMTHGQTTGQRSLKTASGRLSLNIPY